MDVRVYYEDTDAGGVVYHANYLRYFERGRTEFLRERGLCVQTLHNAGVLFAVVSIQIDYRAPARLGDLLTVETSIAEVRNSSFVAEQKVRLKEDGKLLCEGRVTLACVGEGLRARRLPPELREAFQAF